MASSYASVSALVPIIFQAVLDYAKENFFMPNLVVNYNDQQGMQVRTFRTYPSSGTVWNSMVETVDMTAQDFNYTSLATITPKEVGYRIDALDQRLATDGKLGVDEMADIAREFTYKIFKQVEVDLLSNFSAFTLGTVWAGTTASTAGTLTWGNIYAARSLLEKNKIPGPYYAVVDNYHYHYLATAANIAGLTNAAPLNIRNDIQTNYLVTQVTNDMFLYTSPNIGTTTAAQYNMGVYSKPAIALDIRRGFRIEPQRDASFRLTELNATMWYGAGLIQPTWGALLRGTVLSAPNN
jgi:hypothetical protein